MFNEEEATDIQLEHRRRYRQERLERWGLAKEGEPSAIQLVSNLITNVTGCSQIREERYDQTWFELQEPVEMNDWLRGAPDYCLDIYPALSNVVDSGKMRHMYVEIKLKNIPFKKTIKGGTTQAGSVIPKYGCSSYYLDITPVHRNMNLFCEKLGIDKRYFVIAFVDLNHSEARIISLHQINLLLEDGWNGEDIGTFGEGYGNKCYLIPKNATYDLSNCSSELLRQYELDSKVKAFKILC